LDFKAERADFEMTAKSKQSLICAVEGEEFVDTAVMEACVDHYY